PQKDRKLHKTGLREQPLCNPLSVNDYFNRSRQWHLHFDAIALGVTAGLFLYQSSAMRLSA
ncbi:MAG: hypothetical protein ACYCWC_10590, partial [Rhodocyclaceae bacterium]